MNAKEKIKKMFEEMGIKGDELKETMAYFTKRLNDSKAFEEDVLNEKKTSDGLKQYLHKKASKVKTGNMAMVGSNTVFEWTEDYFHAEEKETPKAEVKPKKQATATKKSATKSKVVEFITPKVEKKQTRNKQEPLQFNMFDDDDDIDWDNLTGEF